MNELSTPERAPTATRRRLLAWGVHLFTASGAVFGALALLSIGAGDFQAAAVLMLLTLAIDSADGTLARAVGVKQALPDIDGRRLDDIVDFLNYVIVPAVFMAAGGHIAGWGFAAMPILASAYGFSHEHAKTEDDFFLGWPSYWNVVAIYLWLLDLSAWAGTLWVAGFSIAIFVPFKYLYPSRLKVLRAATIGGAMLWAALFTASVFFPEAGRRYFLVWISLLYPVYYMLLSFKLGGLQR